jgi:hypothetical protein
MGTYYMQQKLQRKQDKHHVKELRRSIDAAEFLGFTKVKAELVRELQKFLSSRTERY